MRVFFAKVFSISVAAVIRYLETAFGFSFEIVRCIKIRIYEKDICDRSIADPFILWRFLVNILMGNDPDPTSLVF